MDKYDRLDVHEAAEKLGLPVEQVIQLCTDGLLEACDTTYKYEFWIEQKEIRRWKEEGPLRRMRFEEAMSDETGVFVRRAAWPMYGLTKDPDGKGGLVITKWYFEEHRYPGKCEISRYEPTDED